MARGWESKSVESQIEEANSASPTAGSRSRTAEEAQVERKRSDLLLSRKRVEQQLERSNDERYSQLLRLALADLDERLAEAK